MSEIDIPAVRRSLASVDLNGFVALLDYLVKCIEEREEVLQIGTTDHKPVDIPAADDEDDILGKLDLRSFWLGRMHDGETTALVELALLTPHFVAHPSRTSTKVHDRVCADLAERDERKWKVIVNRAETLRRRSTQ